MISDDECAEDLGWNRIVEKISGLVKEKPSQRKWSRAVNDWQYALVTQSSTKSFMFEAFGEYISNFVQVVKEEMDAANSSRAVGGTFCVYASYWIRFIELIRDVHRRYKATHAPSTGDLIFLTYVSCWTDKVILGEASPLLKNITLAFSQFIFNDKSPYDMEKLRCILTIFNSFRTLNPSTERKILVIFENMFIRTIIEEMLPKITKETLEHNDYKLTILKVAHFKRAIIEIRELLGLSRIVRTKVEFLIARELSTHFFDKMNRKLLQFFHTSLKADLDEFFPLTMLETLERIELLPQYSVTPIESNPDLLEWCIAFANLRFLCGRAGGNLHVEWLKSAAASVSSFVCNFPGEHTDSVIGRDAYLNLYYDAWSSFCKLVFLHTSLAAQITLHITVDFSFIESCFSKWILNVLEPQRKILYKHLIDYFREYFSKDENEPDGKVVAIVSSLRLLTKQDLGMFQNAYTKEIMTNYFGKVLQNIADHLKSEVCTFEFLQQIHELVDRVEKCRKRLRLSAFVTKKFGKSVVALFSDFFMLTIEELIINRDVKTIDSLCRFIQKAEKDFIDSFYDKVESCCKKKGQELLKINKDKENVAASFIETIKRAAVYFNKFLADITNQTFTKVAWKAFKAAVALTEASIKRRPSEILLYYLNNLLSRDEDVESDEQRILAEIAKIAPSLKFIPDVDDFSQIYGSFLARRLLYGGSVSVNFEEQVLRSLHEFLDSSRTAQMHLMIADLRSSETRTEDFLSVSASKEGQREEPCGDGEDSAKDRTPERKRKWAQTLPGLLSADEQAEEMAFARTVLEIRVLRDKVWPIEVLKSNFTPALPFQRILRNFEMFYKQTEGNARSLTWVHEISLVHMIFNFTLDQEQYEVKCNTFVASLMLMFQDKNEVTFDAIKQRTQLTDTDLKCMLDTLISLKVLGKKEAKASAPATLTLNLQFKCKLSKFSLHVPFSSNNQTPKSKPETNEAMNKKGLACVQATMVRIAKRNTKMPKKKLVEETIWTLAERMCPEPELITESVENLVDKGYFEYNPTTDVLHYIP